MKIPDYSKYAKKYVSKRGFYDFRIGFEMCGSNFSVLLPLSVYRNMFYICSNTTYSFLHKCPDYHKYQHRRLSPALRNKLYSLYSGKSYRAYEDIDMSFEEITTELGVSQYNSEHIRLFCKNHTLGLSAYSLIPNLINRKIGIDEKSS